MEGLKDGLHHCFVDKSKSVKRNIAVELENIAHLVQKRRFFRKYGIFS